MADTATAAAPGWLEDWLARLDDAGFHVGMRERLLAHALLARAAVAGALPREPAEAARLLGPLVCSSPLQQRRYAELLAAWAPPGGPGPAAAPQPAATQPRAAASAVWRWWPGVGMLLLAAFVWWWRATVGHGQDVAVDPGPVASAASVAAASAPVASAASAARSAVRDAIYVPPRDMPFEPAPPPGWQRPLRTALGLVALLSLLALGWAWWRQRRRALFLKGTNSDEEVEEQVLRERAAATSPVAPPPSMLRPASRLLRQRMAGVREELDVPRTIRATLDAGGAFVPRWRSLAQTPEYLVLIDSRGPADHLVRYQRALVEALAAHNVALTVYEFEVTPEHGCWRVRPGDGAPRRFDRSSLAELGGRYAGQRLLVFADPGIALHPTSGAPRAWATQLKRDFPAAAWFSPRPLASWGAAELQVAEQRDLGFLLLPAHHEALEAVAGWFASERAHLQLPPDLPGPWPVMLGDDALAWAIRAHPPEPEALDHLLFELRQYLGAWRFQWLAACAVFPTLAWPLTLGLGAALRETEGEDERGRALALGIAALGPLPWFRYGHMPAWLREALIERLTAENEARCRALIEQRLAAALPAAGSSALVTLALRRAWLQRGGGVARDLVLVDFLQRGERLARLAQRLPEALRRWLFRNGRPAYGLQRAWLALPALFVLVGALAWTPLWQRVLPPDEVMRLQEVDFALPGAANSAGIVSLAISADGLRVMALEKVGDGKSRLRWTTNRGDALQPVPEQVPDNLLTAVLSPLADRMAGTGPFDGLVRLWELRTGRFSTVQAGAPATTTAIAFDSTGRRIAGGSSYGIVLALVGDDRRLFDLTNGGTTAITRLVYSGDDLHIAALAKDGRVTLWDLKARATIAAPTDLFGQGFTAMAFAPEGSRLWLADRRGVGLWDLDAQRWLTDMSIPSRYRDAVANTLAADPTGAHVAAGWSDGTITVHSADSGAVLARAETGAAVSALAFSPDGSRLVSGDEKGRLRWWGAPHGVPLRVVGCSDDTPEGITRRWPTLFSGSFDDGRTVVDPIAYTPKAAHDAGQLADPAQYEVVNDAADARQAALARQVLARLEAAQGREPSRWPVPSRAQTAWRARTVPGTLTVTVHACGAEESAGADLPTLPPSAPVPAAAPLAALHFEVFQCSPVDAAARAITSRVQQALRRLGAADVKASTVGPDIYEKLFRAQDGPYQIRISRGRADEAAAAKLLLADAGFAGEQSWRPVTVAQQSRGYVGVVVCPAALSPARGAAASATAGPNAIPNVATNAAPTPPPQASAATLGGRARPVAIYGLSHFSGRDPPDLSAAAYRLGALGDMWFSIGSLNPARNSNVLFELELPQSTVVVNASGPGDTLGASINLTAARQLLGIRAFDAVLLSAGIGHMVALVDSPKQPLIAAPRATKTGISYLNPAALASVESELRSELRSLVALRDRSVNRGVPLVLHTYDYLTPRPAGAGLGAGPWLLPALTKRDIPEADQAVVARQMIDELARMLTAIAQDAAQFPNVYVIDTRGTLTPAAPGTTGQSGDWLTELMPTWQGSAKLAARWQVALSTILAESRARPSAALKAK